MIAGKGVKFDSSDLIISVAHALGMAAVLKNTESEQAYQIERFIKGQEPYSAVPSLLAKAGAYGCLHKNVALELSRWIRSIDHSVFADEVYGMLGSVLIEKRGPVAHGLKECTLLDAGI